MKSPSKTRTLLKDVREARGFSAAELAGLVQVSRQTIYAIEDGSFVPNTTVALRLARVLDVTVEDLFSLDQPELPALEAELLSAKPDDSRQGELVRLCRVDEKLIAIPVSFVPAYLPRADGIVSRKSGRRVSVRAGMDLGHGPQRLLLAGCDPALSVLAEALHASGIEIINVPCSSRGALEWLKQGRVHAAGSHLLDAATGDYNVPFIRRLFPKNDIRVVHFASWEQGLVLARGNPKKVGGIADLAGRRVTLINREKGSGSRDLLDKALRNAGIAPNRVIGYESSASGHLSAAHAVSTGAADCCIATRCAARYFGLDFIPLSADRFDLSFSKGAIGLPAVKALLDLLNGSSDRRKLETIAGYDTAHTGEVLA